MERCCCRGDTWTFAADHRGQRPELEGEILAEAIHFQVGTERSRADGNVSNRFQGLQPTCRFRELLSATTLIRWVPEGQQLTLPRSAIPP